MPLFSNGCILGGYWTPYCEAKKDWKGIGSQEDQTAYEDNEKTKRRQREDKDACMPTQEERSKEEEE